MNPLRPAWKHVRRLVLLLVCSSVPALAVAQSDGTSIRGRVVGPDEAPLAGQTVVLHRVEASSGATIAEATTTGDGSFELMIPAGVDTAAIYFVAARYEGELYIGPPFRPGQDVGQSQTIQVGVPGTSARALLGNGGTAMPQPLGRAATSRNWLLLLIPLVGVAAVAMYAIVPRGRMPPERAVLIRIAELDERMTGVSPQQREPLLEERARLLARLHTS